MSPDPLRAGGVWGRDYGIARVQRLPEHLVGVAMCDHKVNFEPGFETA